MTIERLNYNHIGAVKNLFYGRKRFMGISTDANSLSAPAEEFNEISYINFCDTYLSDLNNYHAYGCINGGEVVSYISFFESNDQPEWYMTQFRSKAYNTLPGVFDVVLHHNESRNRYRFYSLFNAKYRKGIRRFLFNEEAARRYSSYDDYIVPAKTKCIYQLPWQILFNRILVPVDTVVRYTFLNYEYKTVVPVAGNL